MSDRARRFWPARLWNLGEVELPSRMEERTEFTRNGTPMVIRLSPLAALHYQPPRVVGAPVAVRDNVPEARRKAV